MRNFRYCPVCAHMLVHCGASWWVCAVCRSDLDVYYGALRLPNIVELQKRRQPWPQPYRKERTDEEEA